MRSKRISLPTSIASSQVIISSCSPPPLENTSCPPSPGDGQGVSSGLLTSPPALPRRSLGGNGVVTRKRSDALRRPRHCDVRQRRRGRQRRPGALGPGRWVQRRDAVRVQGPRDRGTRPGDRGTRRATERSQSQSGDGSGVGRWDSRGAAVGTGRGLLGRLGSWEDRQSAHRRTESARRNPGRQRGGTNTQSGPATH